MTQFINEYTSLPNTKVDLLIKSLDQNSRKLSKKKKEKLFAELGDQEINILEEIFMNE